MISTLIKWGRQKKRTSTREKMEKANIHEAGWSVDGWYPVVPADDNIYNLNMQELKGPLYMGLIDMKKNVRGYKSFILS